MEITIPRNWDVIEFYNTDNMGFDSNSDFLGAFAKALEPYIRNAVLHALEEANPTTSEPAEDICLIDEACVLTGLAKQTIYTHTYHGTIPFFKRGKRLYFSKKDLREWIKGAK